MANDNIIVKEKIQKNYDNMSMPLFFRLFVFVGILMIFFGTKSLINNVVKTKDYLVTTGTCVRFNKYGADDGVTYSAVFEYIVNDKKYTIEDETMNRNTKTGTIRKIKYNAENPNEAIVNGFPYSLLVIIIGLLFSLPLVIAWYVKEEIIALLFGLFFTLIGIFFLIFFLISSPEFNLNNLIFILFSLIFLAIGLYILICSIIEITSPKTAKKIRLKFAIKWDNINILTSKFLPIIYIVGALIKTLLALIIGILLCISPIIFKIGTSEFIIILLFEGFGLVLISYSLTNFIKIYENYKDNKSIK